MHIPNLSTPFYVKDNDKIVYVTNSYNKADSLAFETSGEVWQLNKMLIKWEPFNL